MRVIAIAGGSGSGKSTLTQHLIEKYPKQFEVLSFDDYQRVGENKLDLPHYKGIVNWDHPDIIRWSDIIVDIKKLQKGEEVITNSWSRLPRELAQKDNSTIEVIINPRPILIVEGYLALYNDDLNGLYDKKIFLSLNEKTRNARRRAARGGKDSTSGVEGYIEKVLNPMHRRYVEPTRIKANLVVDVAGLGTDQLAQKIMDVL